MDFRKTAIVVVIVCALSFGTSGTAALVNELTYTAPETPIIVSVTSDDGITSVSGVGEYEKGSKVKLTALLEDGYVLKGWYDSKDKQLSTTNPYEFDVTDAVSIKAVTVKGFNIETYKMDGIDKVTGSGSYTEGSVTVTATLESGYIFGGWYSLDGTKLTDNLSYTFTDGKNHSVVAKTDSGAYLGNEILKRSAKEPMKSESVTWIVTDWRTGDYVNSFTGMLVFSFTVSPGKYHIRMDGVSETGHYVSDSEVTVVEGLVEKLYLWYYEGDLQYLIWDTQYSVYNDYQTSTANRFPSNTQERLAFADYNSTSLNEVVSALTERTAGFDEMQRANYVLKFVQCCTEYEHDEDYNGQDEYWKYPYETLYDRSGDCEDTSLLYCTLMKKMGYSTALMLFFGQEEGHAAAGVAFAGSYIGGEYVLVGSTKYYYCETTSDTMVVSEQWSEYPAATATYVLVIP